MLCKPVFLLIIGIVLSSGMTACRTSKEEQATRSVNEFLEAIEEEDFAKAKELSTDKSKPILVTVEKEAKDYRKTVKPDKIKIEIVDKKVEDMQALVTVTIRVGPKIKKEKIKLVWVNNHWLVVVQKPQVHLVRYVVFYDQYELIVLPKIRLIQPVIQVSIHQEHHSHNHGHAYGHHKNKHRHKHHDD